VLINFSVANRLVKVKLNNLTKILSLILISSTIVNFSLNHLIKDSASIYLWWFLWV